MSTSDNPSLTLTGPADLLAAVPFLLGYRPADSLVLVTLAGTRIVLVSRHDLPTPDLPATITAAYLDDLVTAVETAARHGDATFVIGYGPADPVTLLVDVTTMLLAAAGLRVGDALRVTDGRYRHSPACPDPACCPPDGVAYDPDATVTAAEAVFAGLVALPDRAALKDSIAPLHGQRAEQMDQAIAEADRRLAAEIDHARISAGVEHATSYVLARGEHAVTTATTGYRAGAPLSDPDAAELLLLLQHPGVRDLAMAHTTGDEVALWTDLTRRAPDELASAPATLLGYAAYRAGTGALATIALRRALRADPDYTMAHLLLDAIHAGMPAALLADSLTTNEGSGPDRDTSPHPDRT